MRQAWKVSACMVVVAGGCFGPPVERHLMRAQLGVNSRRVAMPGPQRQPAGAVARTTRPVERTTAPLDGAVTGAAQMSVRALRHLYVGAEIEAGVFDREGSNYGGAYGVLGVEANAARAWISLELAAGRQWLRTGLGADDVGVTMLEPRVRAQLLFHPQLTLGAMIGASALPEDRGWAAGLYFGVYSHALDGSAD